jgi:pre-mRNA-splicing helicase BRR2
MLIDILAHASEFGDIPIRYREEKMLQQLSARLPIKLPDAKYNDPHVKANLLLQAHFSRVALSAELQSDLELILGRSVGLVQAMVDVLSSQGWLKPALAAMELAQMLTQAVWDKDSVLKQIPHFTADTIARCEKAGIESVFDVLEASDADRDAALQMDARKVNDVAVYCNRYPAVDVQYKVVDEDELRAGETVGIQVQMEREDDAEDPGPVVAPFFPKVQT